MKFLILLIFGEKVNKTGDKNRNRIPSKAKRQIIIKANFDDGVEGF
jgi:hypothetical protein